MPHTDDDNPRIRLGEINYDPERGQFSARVDVERFGTTYRYPCAIHAPESMQLSKVRYCLMARALLMSDTARRTQSHIH